MQVHLTTDRGFNCGLGGSWSLWESLAMSLTRRKLSDGVHAMNDAFIFQ